MAPRRYRNVWPGYKRKRKTRLIDIVRLNLRHLCAALAVVRHGSANVASAHVFMSQPAITQAIGNLERALEAQLFERRPNGMTPTPSGEILAYRVARMTDYFARGARALRTGEARQSGGFQPIERLMTATQLRAIVEVIRHGGYSLAARANGLSTAAVHRATRDLERLAGVPMLDRAGRIVRATDRAVAFARHARLALAEIEAAVTDIAALQGVTNGLILIGAMPLGRSGLVPRAVAALQRELPEVEVRIHDGAFEDLLKQLIGGDLDVLVGARRDPPPSREVVQSPLFQDMFAIVARHDHPLAIVSDPNIATLARYPWIVAGVDPASRANLRTLFTSHGREPPPAAVVCGSIVAVRELLMAGDYLTLLSPRQVQIECAAGLLAIIGAPIAATTRTVCRITRRDWHPASHQTRFLELLQEAARTIQPA